ncbi:hypothetical protein OKW33_003539 [Paraburkholderia atlantica]|uniref:hypothetical protein n=1 Tax=Paraburkholderia atlantica TaxID=2654982 RepID=UPI00128DC758|nr:hypothetical protein [Paraburkholderia atlantica]MPW06709.1 hypothetical protein [Paraburkholderia atlantica]
MRIGSLTEHPCSTVAEVAARGNQRAADMAAGYLAIKQRKYTDPYRSDPTLSDRYNTNVEKCLDHIAKVMAQLGDRSAQPFDEASWIRPLRK